MTFLHVHVLDGEMFSSKGPIPGRVPDTCHDCGASIAQGPLTFVRDPDRELSARRRAVCVRCSDPLEEAHALRTGDAPPLYWREDNDAIELFGGGMFGVIVDHDAASWLVTFRSKDGQMWRGKLGSEDDDCLRNVDRLGQHADEVVDPVLAERLFQEMGASA